MNIAHYQKYIDSYGRERTCIIQGPILQEWQGMFHAEDTLSGERRILNRRQFVGEPTTFNDSDLYDYTKR